MTRASHCDAAPCHRGLRGPATSQPHPRLAPAGAGQPHWAGHLRLTARCVCQVSPPRVAREKLWQVGKERALTLKGLCALTGGLERARLVEPRPQGKAARSFGSRDDAQPLLSPRATGVDLLHHTRSHKGGPQQHMARGLLQRHDVPCKCILPGTLAVLEDFSRHDCRLPKRSAQPPGAPLSPGDREQSSRSKRYANSSPGRKPCRQRERGDRSRSKEQRCHQPEHQQQSNKEAAKGCSSPQKG